MGRTVRASAHLVGWGVALLALYWASLHSYLLFHSLAELFSIVVATGIFLVAWNARGFLSNDYLLFLGTSSLFVGFLDAIHTLAYKGMGVFPGHDANLPTQLWIAARYMGSLSFLLAPLYLRRRVRMPLLLAAYALATGLVLLAIFTWGIFPTCYVEGQGLTPFKKISEYVISLLLGGSILLLVRHKSVFDPGVLRLVVGSIGVSILSELSFTLYVSVYGFANLLGHYLKILAFYLIYLAIIHTGLRKPYELLFRDLKQSQETLQKARDELDQRVRERTAELSLANAELRVEIADRKRAEEALAVRTDQLEAVRAVTAEIARELNLRRVLDLIIRRAVGLLRAVSGTVSLWEETTQELVPHASTGLGDWRKELRFRLGEGVSGRVADQREGLILNDYRASPLAHPSYLEQTAVAAKLAEPLLYRDRLIGVITIDRDATGGPFTPQDRETLVLFAAAAAIAIENARLFEEVQSAQAGLEALSRRLVEVQEAERRHIARELHDEVGQALTGLKLLLEMAGRGTATLASQAQEDARALVGDLLDRVRSLSLELRPAMLDDLGLLPALAWYIERYRTRSDIAVTFKHLGLEEGRLPPAVETAAYRIVQEALTNVARHARVAEVTVRAWVVGEKFNVQIEDRGVGFVPQAAVAGTASSGLAGMRERAALLGGQVTVESTPGQGTCVTAEFPLSPWGRNTRTAKRPGSPR